MNNEKRVADLRVTSASAYPFGDYSRERMYV